MSLASFSLKRPVTISMFYLGIVIFGVMAYTRLPQELFPSLSYPEISIFTRYENASPEEIENLITNPLEETVSTVSRLKRIKSTSREGLSLIQVSFNWGTDMDMAGLAVREKIDLVRDRLPDEAGEPIILKMNPFELPVMVISFYLDRENKIGGELGLTSLWKKRLKDELEKVEGVANSQVAGGLTPEIEVVLEPGALWSKGLSLREVADTLEKANYSYPAGLVADNYFEYLVRTEAKYRTVEDIKKTLVKREKRKISNEEMKGEIVSLEEVGRVEEMPKKRTSFSRYNGRPSLTISFRRQSGANTMAVCRGLREKIEYLRNNLPSGMRLSIIYDQSRLLKEAMAGVKDSALAGGVLSFFILYLFMRDFRSSFLVSLSIPISCLGGFILVYLSGLSLNIVSLGGFALGVGMMVDNAIVVVENLGRRDRPGGESPKEIREIAARTGEVGPAIVSSTLTTAATFLPMVFVTGLAGQMIKELALAITFCLFISLLVAFTFIPCFWRRMKAKSREDNLSRLEKRYEQMLSIFLKRKKMFLAGIVAVFGLSLLIFLKLPREFLPEAGEATFYLDLQMPQGTSLLATDETARSIEKYLLSQREIKEVTATVGELEDREAKMAVLMGPHQARLMINLKNEFRKKRAEVIKRTEEYLTAGGLKGGSFKIIIPQGIMAAKLGEAGLALEIKGYSLPDLRRTVERLKEELINLEGIEEITDDLSLSLAEKEIKLNREKIALYGLSVKEVAEAIQASRIGVIATYLKRQGEDIPVRIRLREGDWLGDIFFTTWRGERISLKEVAGISKTIGPAQIYHLDAERAVTVSVKFLKEKSGWSDSRFIGFLNKWPRPKGISLGLAGERAMIKESFRSLAFTLALAIVLIYMIMAAQFESLWQPFIIMFSLPLALIGISFSLFLSQMSLNIISLLGIILLGGIAVNNGIVLVSCIDQYVQEMPLSEAVIKGSVRRLRPVLMTTLTTIVGLIPLSLGLGQGAELRSPMAMAVMGGLTASTILTLFVIPALYLIKK